MRVDFKKGAITVFLNGDHLGDMVKAGGWGGGGVRNVVIRGR